MHVCTFAFCFQGVLNLLGKNDHKSARKALKLNMILCAACVFIGNLFLYFFRVQLSQIISNDKQVQNYFCSFVWILCIHTQVRITVINLSSLLIPMGLQKFFYISKLTNYLIGVLLVASYP